MTNNISIDRYFTLIRLDPAAAGNGYKRQRISAAESYFYKRYPELRGEEVLSESRDRDFQGELLSELEENIERNGDTIEVLGTSAAALCLRCYLSYFVLFACQEFVRNFSNCETQFDLTELLALVLTDEGGMVAKSGDDRFQRESLQILRDYLKRDRSLRKSLGGWTYMRIRQNRAIEDFLIERGIYLESNWGILNATSVTALKKVLEDDKSGQFSTPSQIDRATAILQSYHTIYRGDRRKKRQYGRCQPPTDSQQNRIVTDLKSCFQIEISPPTLMSQLQAIAQQLRNYRIACENPMWRSEALDAIDPETGHNKLEALADLNTVENDTFGSIETQHWDTLRQFLKEKTIACLDWGIDRGFRDLLEAIGKKSVHLVEFAKPALRLLYCERISQTEVAKRLNLTQSQVSRQIKPLAHQLFDRVRYRTQENLIQNILNRLKKWEIIENPQQRDYFDNLVQQVEFFLQKRIFLESEANLKDVRTRTAKSPYVRRLCLYLDRNREN
jgi:predicted transcriptional regulator